MANFKEKRLFFMKIFETQKNNLARSDKKISLGKNKIY